MSKESAIRFLREMRSNEKTKDLLQGLGKPASIEDKIKACAKIAHDLGEDVSYEDLADALEEIEAGRMKILPMRWKRSKPGSVIRRRPRHLT